MVLEKRETKNNWQSASYTAWNNPGIDKTTNISIVKKSPFKTHRAVLRKLVEGRILVRAQWTVFSIVQVLHNPKNDLLHNLHCAFLYLWTGALSEPIEEKW